MSSWRGGWCASGAFKKSNSKFFPSFSFRAHYSPRPNRESERGREKEDTLADAVRFVALVCGAVAEEDLPPVVSRLPACGVGLHRLAVPHHPLLLGFELDQVLEFLEMKSDLFSRSWFMDLH